MNTEELLQKLGAVSVCQIADAVGKELAIDTTIRPLQPSFHVCAPAYTVRCSPNDNLTLHHALYAAKPGQVLVVEGGEGDAACWGELMSISAQAKGLSGTIIDGSARDPLEIGRLNYPVFARSIRARRASKEHYGDVSCPVHIGDITVLPGQIVVADCNGIVSFDLQSLPRILEQSLAVVAKEDQLKETLRSGTTYFELAGLSSLLPERARAAQ